MDFSKILENIEFPRGQRGDAHLSGLLKEELAGINVNSEKELIDLLEKAFKKLTGKYSFEWDILSIEGHYVEMFNNVKGMSGNTIRACNWVEFTIPEIIAEFNKIKAKNI